MAKTGRHGSRVVFLETDRLVLRRLTADDVDHLYALDSDPEVMRHITGGRPTPREEIERVVLPRMAAYYARYPGYGFWAAEEKATGRFVGWFHLRPAPPGEPGHPGAGADDEPELGYRLIASAWGRGYATEGSRALVDLAFGELGARRVFATTMAVNAASRRVMEKVGLRLARAFHLDWPEPIPGSEHGEVEYALDLATWRDRRAGADPAG